MKKMIKLNKGWIMITNIIILIPLLVGIIYWDKLPDEMPTHFGMSGEADSFSSKAFAVFVLPLFPLILQWFMILICAADKEIREGNAMATKVFRVILLLTPCTSIYIAFLEYGYALGMTMNANRIVLFALGLVFCILGNYIPKVKQNSTIGVRLPWTLKNKENWNRTNRLGGWLMLILGVMMFLDAFLLVGGGIGVVLLIGGGSILISIILIVYSASISKK